jgi:hypothetical protein
VADGIRTHDHRDHNPGLYQLSYRLRRLESGRFATMTTRDGELSVSLHEPRPRRSGAAAWGERGVADGIRTHDHRDHNPGLYQLSYRHRGWDPS